MFFYNEIVNGGEILGGLLSLTSWSFSQQVTTSENLSNTNIGYDVAISKDGTTIVAGTGFYDGVFIFQKVDSYWTQVQKLQSLSAESGNYFGWEVGVSDNGNIIVVSSYKLDVDGIPDAGSVYVYEKSGSTWIETQILSANDKVTEQEFGHKVAISGDGTTIAASAVSDNSYRGAVYTFEKSGSTWTQTQKIISANPANYGRFGEALSLNQNGSIMVVGANAEPVNGVSIAGSAYVYNKVGSTWSLAKRLVASDYAAGDKFGDTVKISTDGTTIVVGSTQEDPSNISNAGSAYIFQFSNSDWSEVQKLVTSDPQASDWVGYAIDMSSDGTYIFLGVSYEDPDEIISAGSTYVFKKDGSSWTEIQKLTASDKAQNDQFGNAIGVNSDGTIVVVAAPNDDPGLSNRGNLYVFQGS